MEHKGTVMLKTERLILRRFKTEDINQIFNNCWSEFDAWKWTLYKPMHTVDDVINVAEMFTDKWLGAYQFTNRYSWAMELKSTGEVIGRISGVNIDNKLGELELVYEMGKEWWNQGLMTEAIKKIISFFFHEVKVNRIYAYHASGNPASGRVMQKCGMQYEGTMREGCICNNGMFDKVNYAILARDYYSKDNN